ncbi:hypothetical protein BJ684DRAFT_14823 [Piptocephalis cylindrospora]|uniref:AAA+ ATPase domain-containing protein n=1 Tax=Piptocephalis cylindrospora TaxID=1907219 RepID=A0A4V1IYK5_9FUNG|nr:hypothetical protein BJ684DRAFT_14823 [Piptocephalis cylindrospora]|eukprot:RKP14879.1 hypothetical protein BJ684DRAFT_14823 [Piptocephalis cylindrospora]
MSSKRFVHAFFSPPSRPSDPSPSTHHDAVESAKEASTEIKSETETGDTRKRSRTRGQWAKEESFYEEDEEQKDEGNRKAPRRSQRLSGRVPEDTTVPQQIDAKSVHPFFQPRVASDLGKGNDLENSDHTDKKEPHDRITERLDHSGRGKEHTLPPLPSSLPNFEALPVFFRPRKGQSTHPPSSQAKVVTPSLSHSTMTPFSLSKGRKPPLKALPFHGPPGPANRWIISPPPPPPLSSLLPSHGPLPSASGVRATGKKGNPAPLPLPLPWGENVHVNLDSLKFAAEKIHQNAPWKSKTSASGAMDALRLEMQACGILTGESSTAFSNNTSMVTPSMASILGSYRSKPRLESWGKQRMLHRRSSQSTPPLFTIFPEQGLFPTYQPFSSSSKEQQQLDLRRTAQRLFPKGHDRFPELYVLGVEEPFGESSGTGRMTDDFNQETFPMPWTVKYAPEKAEHVLGNERRAAKLTQWLQSLRLRPPPRKSVSGKKLAVGRCFLQDSAFSSASPSSAEIEDEARAEDEDEEAEKSNSDGEEDDEDEDMSDFERPNSTSSKHKKDQGKQRRKDYLKSKHVRSSLILLVGPSGSGKTAAAYACAQECGYDVAEVGPESRRTVKDLEREVGGLTKSHIVYGDESMGKAGAEGKRQVLIPLEQADLLFREDMGIWTWLKFVSRTTMRPIIVTCEVPVEDIEWQKILYFQRPRSSLLLNYVWLITLAETRTVPDKQKVLRVCNGENGDGAMKGDVRHALNTLEVMYQRDTKLESKDLIQEVKGGSGIVSHPQSELSAWSDSTDSSLMNRLSLVCDAISASDLLEPSLKRLYKHTETDRAKDGSEDMLGRVTLPSYCRIEGTDEGEGDKGREMEEEDAAGCLREMEWSLPRVMRAHSWGGWWVERDNGEILWQSLSYDTVEKDADRDVYHYDRDSSPLLGAFLLNSPSLQEREERKAWVRGMIREDMARRNGEGGRRGKVSREGYGSGRLRMTRSHVKIPRHFKLMRPAEAQTILQELEVPWKKRGESEDEEPLNSEDIEEDTLVDVMAG